MTIVFFHTIYERCAILSSNEMKFRMWQIYDRYNLLKAIKVFDGVFSVVVFSNSIKTLFVLNVWKGFASLNLNYTSDCTDV